MVDFDFSEKIAEYKQLNISRFVRWNNYYDISDFNMHLPNEFVRLSPPYDDVFMLPGHTNVSTLKEYKEGKLIGVDISSVVAIKVLELEKDDRFLDLCCAPGIKLFLASNEIGIEGCGSVTGVDINGDRISVARSLMKRLKVGKARLFLADGTKFNELAPDAVHLDYSKREQKCSTLSKSLPAFYECSVFKRRQDISYGSLYDKVLVDVECTHDGSVKHLIKSLESSHNLFLARLQDDAEMQRLYQLQYELLENGFRLLRSGGSLVYSTCRYGTVNTFISYASLFKEQNQDIVNSFLLNNADAVVSAIDESVLPAEFPHILIDPGFIQFHPSVSKTSGLFIAKITKL